MRKYHDEFIKAHITAALFRRDDLSDITGFERLLSLSAAAWRLYPSKPLGAIQEPLIDLYMTKDDASRAVTLADELLEEFEAA